MRWLLPWRRGRHAPRQPPIAITLEGVIPASEIWRRWIEVWYNRHRIHSALGYRSPVAFEQALAEEARVA